MTDSKRTTTDNVHIGVFKPHGRMQVEQTGQMKILEATGPFNIELVIAADVAQDDIYKSLNKLERWGTVLIFRKSALASPDALAEITRILTRRKEEGFLPVAVALVIGVDVEGVNVMTPHFLNVYQKAGINGRAFTSVDEAKQWMTSVINAK